MGASGVALAAGRILVVDDEETILDAATSFLGSCGFEAEGAREREEAEALLSTNEYDLVIADMRMTGVHGREGLELLTYLRDRCPRTRVVILTAYGSEELEAEIMRRGADVFLQKPLPLGELARVADELIGAAQA